MQMDPGANNNNNNVAVSTVINILHTQSGSHLTQGDGMNRPQIANYFFKYNILKSLFLSGIN